MSITSYLRGVWESIKWIVETVWDWLLHPRVGIVVLAISILGCPVPKPTPSPSPTPEPTPTPVSCVIPESPGWEAYETIPAQNLNAVMLAEHELGSVCGQEPSVSLQLLASKLVGAGNCAENVDDAVFVRRTDDRHLYEEYHAVAYTTGCWTSRTRVYRGVWHHE